MIIKINIIQNITLKIRVQNIQPDSIFLQFTKYLISQQSIYNVIYHSIGNLKLHIKYSTHLCFNVLL